MGKCKNIECDNKTEGNRVYCSLSCRNYYVNKYIRDYSKISETLSKDTKEKYKNNPKFCKHPECGKKIPYKKRDNKYCSKSCSAKISGLGRKVKTSTKEKLSNQFKGKRYVDGKWVEIKVKNICKNCGGNFPYESRRKYCSNECKLQWLRHDMDEFNIYKRESQFRFALNDFPEEFDFGLIEEHGWYKPKNRGDNLNGVSRDHMISIREGFDMGIDPQYIAHPANCELMVHNENVRKHKTSSLTEKELMERIRVWDEKYN